MKTTFVQLGLSGFVLIAGLAACATSDKSESPDAESSVPQAVTAEESLLVSATATIMAIDVPSREVTLRGPAGNFVTFVVDERVKRLPEFKVGDEVTAEYYIALAAELREPTAEERAAPLTVVDARARAPKGTSPAGGALRMLKVVATVEGLDKSTRSVTLVGPRGNALTVRARDPKNFEKLHVGDTIVVTYTEALAVSLQQVASGGR